jgi:hypothetical protein
VIATYCGFNKTDNFINHYKAIIEVSCSRKEFTRDAKWSESIAVGNEVFLKGVTEQLGIKARSKEIIEDATGFSLKEPVKPYNSNFNVENGCLSIENGIFGDVL